MSFPDGEPIGYLRQWKSIKQHKAHPGEISEYWGQKLLEMENKSMFLFKRTRNQFVIVGQW